MQKKDLGLLAGIVGIIASAGITTALAANTNSTTEGTAPPDMEEHKSAIEETLAADDFEAWQDVVAPQERYDEMKADYDEDGELDMKGHGGKHGGMHKNEAAHEAVENGDYAAFQAATEDAPEQIDEETFNKMVEAHELHESGDDEAAREIMEDIHPGGPGHHGAPEAPKAEQN